MGFGLVIWFIELFQKVTANNYDSLTELHTPKITLTTAFSVFPSRCLVAASHDGCSASCVFPNGSQLLTAAAPNNRTAALNYLHFKIFHSLVFKSIGFEAKLMQGLPCMGHGFWCLANGKSQKKDVRRNGSPHPDAYALWDFYMRPWLLAIQ
jgi:hypothetical protein